MDIEHVMLTIAPTIFHVTGKPFFKTITITVMYTPSHDFGLSIIGLIYEHEHFTMP